MNLQALLQSLTLIDTLSLCWFILCWGGYAWYADVWASRHGLIGLTHQYRLEWSHRLLERDVRVSDAALLGNLMHSVSFYANTTIYIIAGLVAVIGALDKVITLTAELQFANHVTRELWELKLLLLLGVFVIAYFKFTWSIRQFNFFSILIGAAPASQAPTEEKARYASRLATVNTYAGDEFNRGIRAYYYGLAAVTWIVAPMLFLLVTTIVTIVIYRRDYVSDVLSALRD